MRTTMRGIGVFAAAVAVTASLGALPASAQVSASSKKYTTTAEFNLGTSFNVDTAGNQVDLANIVTTFNIMWIANAGEDTVSKVDTTTGRELARYKTWFTGTAGYPAHLGNPYAAAAPSRTAVDSDGNVYVGNRHFDGRAPVLLKILANGFVDRNSNGVENTSTDLNNNGTIEPGELLPLVDTNNNGIIDSTEIVDERIAWATRLPTPAENNGIGRSVAIDPEGNIWFGCYNTQVYYKIRSSDGVILSGPHSTGGSTPYGAVIDGNGILWGASLNNHLLKLDTTDPNNAAKKQLFSHGSQNYGIALGSQNGVPHIYLGAVGGGRYIDFNTVTNTSNFPGAGSDFGGIGIATDGAGNIFVARSTGIRKYSPIGAILWDAGLQAGTTDAWGVVVDAEQNAWLIHRASGNPGPGKIAKYNGATGAALGVFNVGANPYTYSDATGIQRFAAQRQGNWRVVQTNGLVNNAWRIQWNTEAQGAVPAGTTLAVEARTAATQAGLATTTFSPVSNGDPSCIQGAFIEVRASLTSTVADTPVLSDMMIIGKCDVNGDGMVNLTDINAINTARNTPSSGVCDARDADGDGTITVNDGRQCAVRCTTPKCSLGGVQ
ncbi:MAG: hypothetical protein AB7N91_00805 [Candidatus Tectimicrobiota bacterium]